MMWRWIFRQIIDLIFKVTRLNREIIVFDARGCMAHDWRELYRGRIVGVVKRKLYGGRDYYYKFYRVMRADGVLEEVPALHVLEGTAEMQARTDNPTECLVGKLVLVK